MIILLVVGPLIHDSHIYLESVKNNVSK